MFQDEARFGRMNTPRRCWAPQGVRPSVGMQRVGNLDFASLDDVQALLAEALFALEHNEACIQSLTGFE